MLPKGELDQQSAFIPWTFIEQIYVEYCYVPIIVLGLGATEDKEHDEGIKPQRMK